MIKKCESLQYAEAVLTQLAIMHGDDKENSIEIQSWANCREQGYHIINYRNDKAVNVARQRNSDSIIVGWGGGFRDFDMRTNQWSEEVYKERTKCFSSIEDAARFIHDYLVRF